MRKRSKFLRVGVAVFLCFCMVLGCSNGLIAYAAEALSKPKLNYVSIGDSMTNGYCFTGYAQRSSTDLEYDFLNGKGVYGEGAYPLQFEEHLEELGYLVDHTMLAPSATLAGDLWYVLGGRDLPLDGWGGMFDYVGNYRTMQYRTDVDYNERCASEELKTYYQNAVRNADIMTLCLGNAEFGAYLMDRLTTALGLMGATTDDEDYVTLQDALNYSGLDAEQQALVQEAYDYLVTELKSYVPAETWEQYHLSTVCDMLAYATAGFVFNYRGVLDTIQELNEKDRLEIILIGLMNTTYGMTVSMEDGSAIPVGDIMDGLFGILNAYIAGLPAAMQLCGEWQNTTFYYAEQPNPLFISQQFAALKDANWGTIDGGRLNGATVRARNITAFNDTFINTGLLNTAFSSMLGGNTLPKIDLTDVQSYESTPDGYAKDNPLKVYSALVYLGIEDALAASTDTLDIPLESLETLTDIKSLMGVFSGLTVGTDLRTSIADFLTSTEELKGMIKVYAIFKVGNGMSVHPTPAGHDNIAGAVIEAYDSGYTAADKTLDNLAWAANALYALAQEYYDDAYACAYNYAKNAGYIDIAANSILDAQNELNTLIGQLSTMQMTDAFRSGMIAGAQEISNTLSAAANLLTVADQLDQDALESALALLAQAEKAAKTLLKTAEQAGVDTLELAVIPALEELRAKIESEAIPAAKQAAEEIYQKACDYLMNHAGDDAKEAFDALADALVEKAEELYPEIADWVYDYLYENPAKVIAFFNEYGDDAVAFLSQHIEEIMAIVGFAATNYGWDIAAYIVNNADTILATMVSWVQTHGENAWKLIKVYLAELGLLDYLPTQAEIEEAIAMVRSALDECYAKLNGATDEMLAELETLLPALEQQILALQKQVEDYAQLLDAQMKTKLNEAIAELNDALDALEKAAEELKNAVDNQLDTLIPQLEQAYEKALDDAKAALAQLRESFDDAAASVREAIEDLYDALDGYQDMIADLAADAVEAMNAALEQLEKVLNKYADEIDAEVLPQLMQQIGEIAKQLNELEKLIRSYADTDAGEITAQVKDILAQMQKSVSDLIAAAEGQVDKAVSEAIAAFELAYLNATTADYDLTNSSCYVAIGDDTLAADSSYAELLATTLNIPYTKIYSDGLTPAGALELLKNSDEAQAQIYQSDLVTLGFSHNTLVDFMLDNVSDANLSLRKPLDWSVFGLTGLEENVQAALAELQTALSEKLGDATTAAMLTVAVESYVYAYASQLTAYPMLAEAIHRINSDTLIVLVGMSNAFDGVALTLNGEEIELGEYVQYLVDAANMEALAYAMISDNTIYVDAPDVETALEAGNGTFPADLIQALTVLLNRPAVLDPSGNGQKYIEEQILGALRVNDLRTGLWGDANDDGVVDPSDASLVLQYYTDKISADRLNLRVCDVNGDGFVDPSDASLILQYYTEKITVFPVEK